MKKLIRNTWAAAMLGIGCLVAAAGFVAAPHAALAADDDYDVNHHGNLRIGYNRAARLVEQMENAGIVTPMQSNGNREVLAPNRET